MKVEWNDDKSPTHMSLNIEGVTIYLWCIDSYEDLQWGNGESPKQGSEKTQQMLFRSYTWLDFTLKLRTSSLPKLVLSYDRLPESQCNEYHGLEIKSCGLVSRIWDVEAFWYKTEIK